MVYNQGAGVYILQAGHACWLVVLTEITIVKYYIHQLLLYKYYIITVTVHSPAQRICFRFNHVQVKTKVVLFYIG